MSSKPSGGFSLVDYSDEDSESDNPSPEKRPRAVLASDSDSPQSQPGDATPPAAATADTDAATLQTSTLHPFGEFSVTETTPCDPGCEADFAALLSAHGGPGFIAALVSKKEFNNPYALEKISKLAGVESSGSWFPREPIAPEEFFEALAARQKILPNISTGGEGSGAQA